MVKPYATHFKTDCPLEKMSIPSDTTNLKFFPILFRFSLLLFTSLFCFCYVITCSNAVHCNYKMIERTEETPGQMILRTENITRADDRENSGSIRNWERQWRGHCERQDKQHKNRRDTRTGDWEDRGHEDKWQTRRTPGQTTKRIDRTSSICS